ncbi:MAG: hypothetical protein M1835_003674 [Candelina submexicana]|nr:MAG: hypothetical protein M1835_003674 [Candelina submexicana]
MSEPGEVQETTFSQDHRRYQGPIFELCVGDAQVELYAHQSILCQSPVLARFCHANFKEKVRKRIVLEDDDLPIFSLLLDFLYSGGYDLKEMYKTSDVKIPFFTFTSHGIKYCYCIHILVYVLADKYQLGDLQRLAVIKLDHWSNWKNFLHPQVFYTMAEFVYENTATRSGSYFDCFFANAPSLVVAAFETAWFETMVRGGGDCAVAIMRRLSLSVVAGSTKRKRLEESKESADETFYDLGRVLRPENSQS